jgi:hypothetical protein
MSRRTCIPSYRRHKPSGQARVITQTVNVPAGPVPGERVFDHYQQRQSPIFAALRVPPARPGGPGGRHAKGGEETLRGTRVY